MINMKENYYFSKCSHLNAKIYSSIVYPMFLFSFIFLFSHRLSLKILGGILVVSLIFLTICFNIDIKKCGLYLKDKELYHKSLFRKVKKVNIDEIMSIKIVKSEAPAKFLPIYLKDFKGNCLYSMIFLNNLNDKIKAFEGGDLLFITKFKDDIMFLSVYDPEMIKKIREINPDIIVT